MKSGLEGRNNHDIRILTRIERLVSMKSGLEGRNNSQLFRSRDRVLFRLNEVRPRRPEQSVGHIGVYGC